MYLSFSTFAFLTGIKLFIWHPEVFFNILILQSSLMALCGFTHGVFVKTDSYVFINMWNTEFYITLLLRQDEWRYKIWHRLELSWFCKWKLSTNKEIQPMESLWHYFNFISFYINLVYSKTCYNEPMQG